MKTIKNLIIIFIVSLFLTSCYSVDQNVALFSTYSDVNFSKCDYDTQNHAKVNKCLSLSSQGVQIYTLNTRVNYFNGDLMELSNTLTSNTDFGTFEYIDSIKCIRYNEAKIDIIIIKAEKEAERKRYKFEKELKILNNRKCK